MSDAQPSAASAAGRQLARSRWGSTRTDRLVGELLERIDEVNPVQAGRLREALDGRPADAEEDA